MAALAGALVLHERITIPMLAGMLLILGGVSLARGSRWLRSVVFYYSRVPSDD